MTDERANAVIGAGSIGLPIARRVGVGDHVMLADLRRENADAAAKVLSDAGSEVTTATVDVASRPSVRALARDATAFGDLRVVHAAGVSPSQASSETTLKVDSYGTALVLKEFGNIISRGGAEADHPAGPGDDPEVAGSDERPEGGAQDERQARLGGAHPLRHERPRRSARRSRASGR